MEKFSKFNSFKSYMWNRLIGNISFPRSKVGQKIKLENGNDVEIFRQVVFKKPKTDDDKTVLFHVKFRLKGMSPRMNKLFSNFPIPFFVGLPGFCGKFWCLDVTNGDFHGFYKWKSKDYADAYATSFAIKFMTRRSIPESVYFEILEYKGNKFNAYPDTP